MKYVQRILEEAELYLEGASLRAIAAKKGVSHVTVWEDLEKVLPKLNYGLYKQVLDQREKNTPASIEKKEVQERMLKAFKLLTEEDKTILEIADELNSTEFIIYRDLTTRMEDLHKMAPQIVTDIMLLNISVTLKRHSVENSPFKKDEDDLDTSLEGGSRG